MEKNARSYHDSLMAIIKPLNLELVEIDDWNCCGATEYFSIEDIPAYSLVGRNLAIASEQNGLEKLVAPCSACYLNLKKTDKNMGKYPEINQKVNTALGAGGLQYQPGSLSIHHLFEIIIREVGLETIQEKVKKPLHGLRVAPYYGCLVPRPAGKDSFDDPEHPTSMDELLTVLGATVVDFPLKSQCCGGHLTQISDLTAFELIRRLLKNADDNGADIISTLCPMCQLNIDAYQKGVNSHFKTKFKLPIVYFTQLIGLAFGLPENELGFGREIISAKTALTKITEEAPEPAS
jgi:heterodisulfide reductase subunit B